MSSYIKCISNNCWMLQMYVFLLSVGYINLALKGYKSCND